MPRAFRMGRAALVLALALATVDGQPSPSSARDTASSLPKKGVPAVPAPQGDAGSAPVRAEHPAGTGGAPDQAEAPQGTLGKQGITLPDSVSSKPKSRADTVIVVKHHFNHREQIITGSVIMTCLALMLVAMNNYNPR